MRLESFRIVNYRSIAEVCIEPCGDFNVLIGRNNSGKSNLLASIEAFFSSVKPEAINTRPLIGNEIDLHQKNLTSQIQLSAVFAPTPAELEELLSDIRSERPQVKTLLEEIKPESRLSVCVVVVPAPKKFAYVQGIKLLDRGDSRVIFEIDRSIAEELYENVAGMERGVSSSEALGRILRRFDSDDYATVKRQQGRDQSSGPPIEYYFRRYGEEDSNVVAEIVKLFRKSDSYESFQNSVSSFISATDSNVEALSRSPITSPIRTFTGEENTVPQYVKLLLGRLHAIKILHFRERRAPIGSEEARRLLSLKVKRGGTDILARIQSTIDELLGVRVDAFEGPTDNRGQPSAELDVDEFLIQANGSGIREALRLILDTEFGQPNLLLVEEPEIHLHPALETSIMSYLREISRDRQVFITTHSTNFLDTGNFQNVFLVQKDKSTKLSSLSLAEAEEKLPAELGIRLSSLFMYDQIIFVEGPSDEQILREFARTLGVNLGQLNTGFIQMNGVRNLGHYAAAEVVSFLTRRRVKLYFLVDADESKSFHFQRLRDEFGDNAKVHVLEKREIENYLLSPAANIKHLIARKKLSQEAFSPPDEPSFRQLQMDAADSLKALAIWKRILAGAKRPLYPTDKNGDYPTATSEMKNRAEQMLEKVKADADTAIAGLDDLCSEAASLVEADWPNRKMNIVPGSSILDKVYKKFGLRYDKMRDGIGVASQMEKDEIESELRTFIQDLGKSDR